MVLRDASASKNTIRDGGSTALYAAYTVDMVFTVDTVYTVDMVFTVVFSRLGVILR